MEGVRRKGNWLLAAGISLLLSFAHLREEDLLADEAQQVAESLHEAQQLAQQAQQQQQLANLACERIKGPDASAQLDSNQELSCVFTGDHLANSSSSEIEHP